MPNGESRNWIRFLLTLESFNILFGTWPTQICLYPFFIAELQQKLSKEDFQVLQAKIRLVPDEGNPFFSSDDAGNKFNYSRDKSPNGEPTMRAIEWLAIKKPSYYDY
jgi:hypothetical protein